MELTNETMGWHLHLHALIDADWIDAKDLSKRWAKLIGQDFAIVKVKDARIRDYLDEVAKYVVKPNQLANWDADQTLAYIVAFKGQKTFGTFGSAHKKSAAYKLLEDALQADRQTCECGCTVFRFFDAKEWEWYQLTHETGPPTQAPAPLQTAFPF